MVSLLSLLILLLFFAAVTVWIEVLCSKCWEIRMSFAAGCNSHSMFGPFEIFIGMVILQVIVAVIPGEPMEIGAGYAFGAVEGTILCLVGTAIGSSLVFLFTKKLGIRMVEAFISREKLQSLKFLQNAERLNLVIFLAFLIPRYSEGCSDLFCGPDPDPAADLSAADLAGPYPLRGFFHAGGAMRWERRITAWPS